MTEMETISSAISNAYNGTVNNKLGTAERDAASKELNDFYKLYVEQTKVDEGSLQARQKIQAEKEAADLRATVDRERIEAEKEAAKLRAEVDREKLEADRIKAERDAEIEREKIQADKEKSERDAEVEKEKIKTDNKKDRRNVIVKIISFVGVIIISVLSLATDSDNWIGRGSRKTASLIQKFLKL